MCHPRLGNLDSNKRKAIYYAAVNVKINNIVSAQVNQKTEENCVFNELLVLETIL